MSEGTKMDIDERTINTFQTAKTSESEDTFYTAINNAGMPEDDENYLDISTIYWPADIMSTMTDNIPMEFETKPTGTQETDISALTQTQSLPNYTPEDYLISTQESILTRKVSPPVTPPLTPPVTPPGTPPPIAEKMVTPPVTPEGPPPRRFPQEGTPQNYPDGISPLNDYYTPERAMGQRQRGQKKNILDDILQLSSSSVIIKKSTPGDMSVGTSLAGTVYDRFSSQASTSSRLPGITEGNEDESISSASVQQVSTEPAPKTYKYEIKTDNKTHIFLREGEGENAKYTYYLLDPSTNSPTYLLNVNKQEIQNKLNEINVNNTADIDKFLNEEYKFGEPVISQPVETKIKFEGKELTAPILAAFYVEQQIPDRITKLDKMRKLCNPEYSGSIFEPSSLSSYLDDVTIEEDTTKSTPGSLYNYLKELKEKRSQTEFTREIDKIKEKVRNTDWLNSIIDSTHDELIEYIDLIVEELDRLYKNQDANNLSKNVMTSAGSASQPKCHAEQEKLFRGTITYLQTKDSEPRVDWLVQSDAAFINQYNLRDKSPEKPDDIKTQNGLLNNANDLKKELLKLGVKNIAIETGRGVSDFILDYGFNYVVFPTGMDAGNRMTEDTFIKTMKQSSGDLYVLKHEDPRLPYIQKLLGGVNINENITKIKEISENYVDEAIAFESMGTEKIRNTKNIEKDKHTVKITGILQPPPTASICKIIPDYENGTKTYVFFECQERYFIMQIDGAVSVNNLCTMCGFAAKRGVVNIDEEDCGRNDISNIQLFELDLTTNKKIEVLHMIDEFLKHMLKGLKRKNIKDETEDIKKIQKKYLAVLACLKKDGDGRFVAYSKYLKDYFSDKGQICSTSLDILCINELVYNGVITLGCVKASKGQGNALPVNLYCPDTRSSQSAIEGIFNKKKNVLAIILQNPNEIKKIVEGIFANLNTQLQNDKENSLDMVQYEVANSMLGNIDRLQTEAIERLDQFYEKFMNENKNISKTTDEFKKQVKIHIPIMPTELAKWVNDMCMLNTFFTEYQEKMYSLAKPQDCYLEPNSSDCNIICSVEDVDDSADSSINQPPIVTNVDEMRKNRKFNKIYNCLLNAIAGIIPKGSTDLQLIDIHVIAFYTQMILASAKTNEQINDELSYIFSQQEDILNKIINLCTRIKFGKKQTGTLLFDEKGEIQKLMNGEEYKLERPYIQDRKKSKMSILIAAIPTKPYQFIKDMRYSEYKERLRIYMASHKVVTDLIDSMCRTYGKEEDINNRINRLKNKYYVLMLTSAAVMRMHYRSFYIEEEMYNIIEGDLYKHISNIKSEKIVDTVKKMVNGEAIQKNFESFLRKIEKLEPECNRLGPTWLESSDSDTGSDDGKQMIRFSKIPNLSDNDSDDKSIDNMSQSVMDMSLGETKSDTGSEDESEQVKRQRISSKGGVSRKQRKSKKQNKNTKRNSKTKKSKRRQTRRKKVVIKRVKQTHKNK